jgi:S1-C subfamily serine protease
MRRFLAFGPAFVVLLAAAVVMVLAPGAMRTIQAARTAALVDVAQRQLDTSENILERINQSVRNVSVAVAPSVVHIDVMGSGRSPFGSSGSGWIFDTLGHVVTNAHVVGSSDSRVQVQFHDGRVLEARIIGADLDSDIAVIKVTPLAGMIPARRASNQRLEQGDKVFAFGSPFGFKFSMSEGIVSGLGRTARTALGMTRISNFIQTDAAVNPGNSGGPLVNVRGNVVGMNVAIATASDSRGASEGQSAGISFAIPLATIESRVDQIIAGGPIVSGYAGVLLDEFDAMADSGYEGKGVVISDVFEDGPAAKAGIRSGDIVTGIDGQPVGEVQILISMIAAKRPGDVVQLKVWRANTIREFEVVLTERPTDSMAAQMQQRLIRQFGLGLRTQSDRVFVGRVDDESLAKKAGFVKGQVVRAINGVPVIDAELAVSRMVNAGIFRGREVKIDIADSLEADEIRTLVLKR